MNDVKKAILIIATTSLLVALPLVAYMLSNQAAETSIKAFQEKKTILFIWPSAINVNQGENFTLNVMVNTKGQLSRGGRLIVGFDPSKVEFLRESSGNFQISQNAANQNGRVELNLAEEISGEDEMAKLNFSAIGVGDSKVEILPKSVLHDNQGQGNIIKTTLPTIITVK